MEQPEDAVYQKVLNYLLKIQNENNVFILIRFGFFNDFKHTLNDSF